MLTIGSGPDDPGSPRAWPPLGPDRSAARLGETASLPYRDALRAARADAQTRSTGGLLLVRQPAHREMLAWAAVDCEALVHLPPGGATLQRVVAARLSLDLRVSVPGPTTSAGMDPALLDPVDAALAGLQDAWLLPLRTDVEPELTAVRAALHRAVAKPTASATLASAHGLGLRTSTLLVAASMIAAANEQATVDLRAGLVAQLWVRRYVVRDPADGEGHKGFAHVVDGETL